MARSCSRWRTRACPHRESPVSSVRRLSVCVHWRCTPKEPTLRVPLMDPRRARGLGMAGRSFVLGRHNTRPSGHPVPVPKSSPPSLQERRRVPSCARGARELERDCHGHLCHRPQQPLHLERHGHERQDRDFGPECRCGHSGCPTRPRVDTVQLCLPSPCTAAAPGRRGDRGLLRQQPGGHGGNHGAMPFPVLPSSLLASCYGVCEASGPSFDCLRPTTSCRRRAAARPCPPS